MRLDIIVGMQICAVIDYCGGCGGLRLDAGMIVYGE